MNLRLYTDSRGRVPLSQWLDKLKDAKARAHIRARLARVAAGNFGDCKALREGVQELRIDFGPGYRVYLSRQGDVLVLLLCGSNKADQSQAIKQAVDF
ncbi:type II toxin-antitoxin system RelE/ParE family toxin [Ramlibacter sp.]|uniref:type II toxin-antitoxin system RelE/ParE family toxin n=1 Tax=Ramlibacter sp. TaxID=1917967 RepID=UPI003D0F7AEF